jgi:tetrahydromethanopterin S-methyltransferase subunit A
MSGQAWRTVRLEPVGATGRLVERSGIMPGLFSRAKESIQKGVTVAGVKGKEAVDVQKIKGQIKKLVEEKSAALEELGSRVCEMSEAGSFDQEDIKARCAAIAELTSRIRALEEEEQQIHLKAQESLQSSGKE